MNEQIDSPAPVPTPTRSARKGRLLARLNRCRNLLLARWWVLALGLLLGLAVQAMLSRFEKPSFVSVGRMIVSIKLAIPEGSVYTEELSNFLGTQAALMQSGVVLNRAHARLAAQASAPAPHPTLLKVSVLPRTTLFLLQANGADADYTQAFLQACMEEYVSLKREMRAQTSDSTVAGLTAEVLRLEKELRKADEELVAFQGTNSVFLLQEQGNSAGNYLAALNQRLAILKSEFDLLRLLTLDQTLERRQQSGDLPPITTETLDRPPAGGAERADTDYFKARQQILLLKAEQQDLGQFLKPKHPKMIALSEEIARRERLLEIFRQQSAEQLESKKTSLALQIQNLEKEVREWDTTTRELSRKSAEFQRLKANAARIQALYDRLLATLQTLDVNKEISPESVTIMEPASPAFVDRPTLAKKLLIGGLAGLAVGVLVLLLLDRLDDRINSLTELRELFDEEVLGQIPREKPPTPSGELSLIGADDPRHAFVEAYRNLRSSLLYLNDHEQRPRTLLVTSSVPNEGKSLTSANLAITLAHSGARVLLVDADLRKGRLHDRFGLPSEAGLCEALSQGRDWQRAVHPTTVPNLFLLPRGAVTHRSSELFVGPATGRFLESAAAQHDFVILDTPPVMAADDVTSLAPHLDGLLFVLRAEHTSARVARAALTQLYQRQARVLGLVYNAVRPSSGDYYYYHKYQDYYTAYPGKPEPEPAPR